MDNGNTQIVKMKLENGTEVHVEARALGGMEEVGIFTKPFKDLTDPTEAIAVAFGESLKRIKPKKAAVEFGVEIGIESGQLTALICKGSGKANLKITLEFTTSPE